MITQTMSTKEARVLRYVNGLRDRIDLKPLAGLPRSVPGCPRNCAIAAALSTKAKLAEVDDGITVWATKDLHIYKKGTYRPKPSAKPILRVEDTPVYIGEFIGEFDEGKYPHLIKATPSPAKKAQKSKTLALAA